MEYRNPTTEYRPVITDIHDSLHSGPNTRGSSVTSSEFIKAVRDSKQQHQHQQQNIISTPKKNKHDKSPSKHNHNHNHNRNRSLQQRAKHSPSSNQAFKTPKNKIKYRKKDSQTTHTDVSSRHFAIRFSDSEPSMSSRRANDYSSDYDDLDNSNTTNPNHNNNNDNENKSIIASVLTELDDILRDKQRCGYYCNRSCWLQVFEFSLLITGIILFGEIFFIPDEFQSQFDTQASAKLIITKEMAESNSSTYHNWLHNTCSDECGIELFSYYIYNITNPDALYNGSWPILEELGPFVFYRYEYRTNVNFNSSDTTVSYRYVYKFSFAPEYSSNITSINDTVYVINPFFLAIINKWRMASSKFSWKIIVNQMNKSQLYRHDIIWDLLHGITPSSSLLGNVSFSIINFDSIDVMEYTGVSSQSKMRQLIEFYGNTSVNWWRSLEYVQGARETKQWPYQTVTKNSILHAWAVDKYRKIDFIYNQTISYSGLSLFQFVPKPSTYLSSTNFSNNTKYYQDGYDGLINLTSTQSFGTLFYSTKPFFLDAPYYQSKYNKAYGLRDPIQSKDDTYFAIEPNSGTVFKNYLPYQLVFQLFNITGSNDFSYLPNIKIPMYRCVVNAFAPASVVSSYKDLLALLDTYTKLSIYGGPSFGIIAIAVSVWLLCRQKRNKKVMAQREDLEDSVERFKIENFIEEYAERANIRNQHTLQALSSLSGNGLSGLLGTAVGAGGSGGGSGGGSHDPQSPRVVMIKNQLENELNESIFTLDNVIANIDQLSDCSESVCSSFEETDTLAMDIPSAAIVVAAAEISKTEEKDEMEPLTKATSNKETNEMKSESPQQLSRKCIKHLSKHDKVAYIEHIHKTCRKKDKKFTSFQNKLIGQHMNINNNNNTSTLNLSENTNTHVTGITGITGVTGAATTTVATRQRLAHSVDHQHRLLLAPAIATRRGGGVGTKQGRRSAEALRSPQRDRQGQERARTLIDHNNFLHDSVRSRGISDAHSFLVDPETEAFIEAAEEWERIRDPRNIPKMKKRKKKRDDNDGNGNGSNKKNKGKKRHRSTFGSYRLNRNRNRNRNRHKSNDPKAHTLFNNEERHKQYGAALTTSMTNTNVTNFTANTGTTTSTTNTSPHLRVVYNDGSGKHNNNNNNNRNEKEIDDGLEDFQAYSYSIDYHKISKEAQSMPMFGRFGSFEDFNYLPIKTKTHTLENTPDDNTRGVSVSTNDNSNSNNNNNSNINNNINSNINNNINSGNNEKDTNSTSVSVSKSKNISSSHASTGPSLKFQKYQNFALGNPNPSGARQSRSNLFKLLSRRGDSKDNENRNDNDKELTTSSPRRQRQQQTGLFKSRYSRKLLLPDSPLEFENDNEKVHDNHNNNNNNNRDQTCTSAHVIESALDDTLDSLGGAGNDHSLVNNETNENINQTVNDDERDEDAANENENVNGNDENNRTENVNNNDNNDNSDEDESEIARGLPKQSLNDGILSITEGSLSFPKHDNDKQDDVNEI